MTPEKIKLSALLDKLLEACGDKDTVSLKDMVAVFGVRAYGPLLFMFALPNALPSIPGLMAILGLPLVFLSVQMMMGSVPWLPEFIARQSLKKSSVEAVRNKAYPWLLKADKVVRPRMLVMTRPRVERILGAIVLILSLSVFTPIPFTNMLPAIAICLIAIGVLERDGLWIIIGILLGVAALTISISVLSAIFGVFM